MGSKLVRSIEEFDLLMTRNVIRENDKQKAARYMARLRTHHEILRVDDAYRLARRAERLTQCTFRRGTMNRWSVDPSNIVGRSPRPERGVPNTPPINI